MVAGCNPGIGELSFHIPQGFIRGGWAACQLSMLLQVAYKIAHPTSWQRGGEQHVGVEENLHSRVNPWSQNSS
jgi:hypothetical protein